MALNLLVLIIGLIVLVKGADFFVQAASKIAKEFGISEFVIGLTLVAVGTSIPELASSISAVSKQEPGLIVGNIIGSNSANIGLIIGLSASLYTLKVSPEMLRRDGYIMLFVSFIFYLFLANGYLSQIEAVILLFIYISYLFYLFEKSEKIKQTNFFQDFIFYTAKVEYRKTIFTRLISFFKHPFAIFGHQSESRANYRVVAKEGIVLLISGAAIIYGADLLISKAIFFAELYQVPSNIIGVTLIAVGTSLPEVSVSLSAAKRGLGTIAIGNVLGSNIANLLLIGGVSASIMPIAIDQSTIQVNAPAMLILSILYLIFIRSGWSIRRYEGAILLLIYAAFIITTLSINI